MLCLVSFRHSIKTCITLMYIPRAILSTSIQSILLILVYCISYSICFMLMIICIHMYMYMYLHVNKRGYALKNKFEHSDKPFTSLALPSLYQCVNNTIFCSMGFRWNTFVKSSDFCLTLSVLEYSVQSAAIQVCITLSSAPLSAVISLVACSYA